LLTPVFDWSKLSGHLEYTEHRCSLYHFILAASQVQSGTMQPLCHCEVFELNISSCIDLLCKHLSFLGFQPNNFLKVKKIGIFDTVHLLLCFTCITLIFTISFTKLQWSSVYPSGSAVGPQRDFKSPTKAFCVHLKCHIQSETQNLMSFFYFRVVDNLTFPVLLRCPK